MPAAHISSCSYAFLCWATICPLPTRLLVSKINQPNAKVVIQIYCCLLPTADCRLPSAILVQLHHSYILPGVCWGIRSALYTQTTWWCQAASMMLFMQKLYKLTTLCLCSKKVLPDSLLVRWPLHWPCRICFLWKISAVVFPFLRCRRYVL